jgi:hypothetical protein
MPAPIITFLYNHSRNNSPNANYASGDSNWKPMDPVNDEITFLSEEVEDGDPITSKSPFSIPETGSQEASRVFVRNYTTGKWDRVWLAGSNADQGGGGNYKYAFGAYIDGTSQSSVILQAWDSTSRSSYNLQVLGAGTPANSMLRAVSTTNGSPGDEWAGTPIAGDGALNTVALTTGGLENPQMVYFNVRLLVPSTATPFADEPVMCLFLTYS